MPTPLVRCLILLVTFGLLTGLSPRSHAAADAERVDSEYLHTESGLFWWKPDNTFHFQLNVSPLKAASGSGPLYLLTSFQNPQGGKPLVSSAVIPHGSRQRVELVSDPVNGMRDGRAYLVTVRVFADKAHTKLLGTHEQPIVYHQLPPEVFRRYLRDHPQ